MAQRLGRTAAFLVAVCDLAVRALPVGTASVLLARVARAAGPRIFKYRAIRRNLAVVFPELSEAELDRLVVETVAHFGRLMAELARMRDYRLARRGARLVVGGHPLEALARGPAIYVGAHLGNWEVVPLILARNGVRLTIVQTPTGVTAIDRRLAASRAETGQTYVPKARALKACAAALKRGESIALLVDSRVEQGAEVTFFGRRVLVTHFPARMALRFGCPIVVVEAYRTQPGEIVVVFHPPIEPGDARGEEAETALTQRMVSLMEETIRRHPGQWFCNKRRFERPRHDAGAAVSAALAG